MGFGRYMDSCGVCMKYTLFFINLLTFLGGLAVVGLGIWMLVDKSFTTKIGGTGSYLGVIYVLIGTGALIALISCFGCFGAAQEVKCMLVTYFIIVFLIFVTMLVGGILGYVFRSKVQKALETSLDTSLRKYNTSVEDRDEWDNIQKELKCCGITDYEDWLKNSNIPNSCCSYEQGSQPHCFRDSPNLHRDGCLSIIVKAVQKYIAIIGGAGIGVACIMLLEMIFTCSLIYMLE